METQQIIEQLVAERDRLEKAIAELRDGVATQTRRRRRKMSAEARKRIGDAARKRWAVARKKAGKTKE